MKELYALTFIDRLGAAKFYSSKELARAALKKKRDDIRVKPGVDVVVDTQDEFSFIFGWEEKQVVWKVVPLKVDEDV